MRCVKQRSFGSFKNKDKNMFLFVAVFLLLNSYARTDDYYDIQTTDSTEEVVYWKFDASKDKGMDTYPNMDEKLIRNPNFDQHVYKANVWNRRPYTAVNIDFDAIKNWNPPTIKLYTPRPLDIDLDSLRNIRKIKFEDYTVPTIRYRRRGITDWRLFFAILSVILLVCLTFKLCIWLILYFRSRKLSRNNLERIIIIGSEPSQSQSDSGSSSTTPFFNRPGSSQSNSSLPQTNNETQNSDSKRIVILLPVKSQRDTSAGREHSQPSDVEDLRWTSGREGLNPYPEPPPPYSNLVREGLIPHPAPPPPYE